MNARTRALCLALAASLALLACVRLPPLTKGQVAAAAQKWPDTDIPNLKIGRDLYKQRCKECHWLKSADGLRTEKWEESFEEMAENAKLQAQEQALVEHYLWALTRPVAEGDDFAWDAGEP